MALAGHDQWLERPYDRQAREIEDDETAQEHGYKDFEDYLDALRDERDDRKFEEWRERQLEEEEEE